MIIGFERQKQLLGCSEDTSCLAEISGALGASELLTTRLLRAGSSVVAEMRLIDPQTARVLGSSTRRIGSSEDEVLGVIPGLVAETLAQAPRSDAPVRPAPPASVGAPPGAAPSPSAATTTASRGGVSPWVWVGSIASVAAGGGMMWWSQVKLDAHQRFQEGDRFQGITRGEGDAVRVAYPASFALIGAGLVGAGYALFARSEPEPVAKVTWVATPSTLAVSAGGAF